MGVLNTIGIGRRAIGAAAAGIDVTSQNVANANTTGYTRRRLLTEAQAPITQRGVFVGQGVSVRGITRASDRILTQRLATSAGLHAQSEAAEEALRTAEIAFNESDATGIAESLSRFYDALSSIATDPSNASRRQGVLDSANVLANTVSRSARALQSQVEGIDGALTDSTATVNAKLREIAQLNRAIGRSGLSTGAGDLLDRRDQLVYQLGELIGATVDLQEDGQATVFIGGQAVVNSFEARTVSVAEDANGAAQVYVNTGSGQVRVTDAVTGTMGGRIAARGHIDTWLADLDAFASTFADTLNNQHQLGFDANGNPGGAMFSYDPANAAASLAIDGALLTDVKLFAAAGSASARAGDAANIHALADTENAALYGPTATDPSSEISRLVSDVGATVAAGANDTESYGAQLEDLTVMRDSVSRVDTDEEAIRLVEYQASYRAAARVLQAGDELLQVLMSVGG